MHVGAYRITTHMVYLYLLLVALVEEEKVLFFKHNTMGLYGTSGTTWPKTHLELT